VSLGGGDVKVGVRGGGGVKVQKYTSVIQCCMEGFFQSQEFLLLMTIADSPLLGQSASGLNFYDNRGRSPLAD
jgi:hypothetical protein